MCVHKCGWTSKYAYAYLKLLGRKDLWPAYLLYTSISRAIELAERMTDPIPEESSIVCRYESNHAAPESIALNLFSSKITETSRLV